MSYIGNTSTTQSFTPAIDYFSGNGSTTAFTLSRPVASVAQVQVTIDNVAQNPSSAYTVSANTITFTSAPLSGTNNIYVYYTSPITQVIAPGQGTVNTTALGNITNIASGNSSLTLQTGSSNTTAVTVDTSQNVGIGTSSIATIDSTGKTLEIYGGAGGGFIHMTNSTTGQTVGDGFIIGTSIGGSDALLVQRESANMIFRTADTERMRIDSSGNLLVGTTDSSSGATAAKLRIIGSSANNLFVGSATAGGWRITSDALNDAGTFYHIKFTENGTQRGSITSNGTVTVYATTSDYRLKENVKPMTGALAIVSQLKPVTYDWIENKISGQGFIAHELQEVIPNAVVGGKDSVDSIGNPQYQQIDSSILVATLTAAIQELKAINDTQAETINALTARIVALEGR